VEKKKLKAIKRIKSNKRVKGIDLELYPFKRKKNRSKLRNKYEVKEKME